LEAAHRRLKEEMGFDCELKVVDKLIYSVEFENGLKENEYDYLIIGFWEGEPKPNPEEVEEWKWVSLEEVKEDIRKNPEKYTYWFKKALPIVEKYVRE
jgi:isopentenyl-diphosphate delta-isomerase